MDYEDEVVLKNTILKQISATMLSNMRGSVEIGKTVLKPYLRRNSSLLDDKEKWSLSIFFGIRISLSEWETRLMKQMSERYDNLFPENYKSFSHEEKQEYVSTVIITSLEKQYGYTKIPSLYSTKRFVDDKIRNLNIIRMLCCLTYISDVKHITTKQEDRRDTCDITEQDVENLHILGLSFTPDECERMKIYLLNQHIYIHPEAIVALQKKIDVLLPAGVELFLSRMTL